MKTLLLILSILSSLSSVSKTLIIETNLHRLKNKDIGFFKSRENYVWDYDYYKNMNRFENKNGVITYNIYFGDSLLIEIGKYIPLFISGLNSINSDTIVLSNLKLTKYNSIDTLFTTFTKYKKSKSSPYKVKIENSFPLGSSKQVAETSDITINGENYSCKLESVPYNEAANYCTPGEKAYFIETIGVRKYYVIAID